MGKTLMYSDTLKEALVMLYTNPIYTFCLGVLAGMTFDGLLIYKNMKKKGKKYGCYIVTR